MQGCSREGEEKPDPELFTLVRVAVESCLGSGWPAYNALEFYSGPGQTGMLNFHWLLESEAVTDERSGSLDAGTLGYSSSGRGHWPLTEAGSRSGMLNSYWPSAHPGSLGRLSGALNSD